MENFYAMAQFVGETTDVTCWLSRAGLKFEDLGDDPASRAIRKQWREIKLRCKNVVLLRVFYQSTSN